VLDTSIRNTKQKTSIKQNEPPTEELGVETIRTSFLRRKGMVITGKLLSPWFPVSKWKSSLRQLYDRQHILVNCYGSCVYIFSVCHSEALEFSPFLSCLSGARVVHVVHVLTWNYWSHRSLLLSRNHHSESFMMASASHQIPYWYISPAANSCNKSIQYYWDKRSGPYWT
jgi:hypothetical protein